jgi:hypothetical protein
MYKGRCSIRKISCLCVLGAVATMGGIAASPAQAHTLQPILVGLSGPVGGNTTYIYDIELTPNNTLQNAVAIPMGYPSSVTLLDFGVIPGMPTLSVSSGLFGADVTSVGDWVVSTSMTGAALPNATFAGGNFVLTGSNGILIQAFDSPSAANVTLKYVGSGLGTSSLQRSLIQLTISANGVPTPTVLTLSMDGNPVTGVQQADSYSANTLNPVGGPGGPGTSVPLPPAVWAGISTLSGCGLLNFFRKRRFN